IATTYPRCSYRTPKIDEGRCQPPDGTSPVGASLRMRLRVRFPRGGQLRPDETVDASERLRKESHPEISVFRDEPSAVRDQPLLHHCGATSSRLRSVAASTHSNRAERVPCSSNTRRPAAVVPPGDVTMARRATGSPYSSSIAAEPTNSCRTSASAMGRVKPASTPASVNASATRNKYAGPLPMSPVTASSSCSGTRTTVPTADRMLSAQSRSSSLANSPPHNAAAPLPSSAGVLGIERTTATLSPQARWRDWIDTPAAMDNTRRAPAAAAAVAAASASYGLTAITACSQTGSVAATAAAGHILDNA